MTDLRVHVVNGSMAGEALVASGRASADAVLVLHDVLSCGPLPWPEPAHASPPWQAVREQFWRRVWSSATAVGWLETSFAGFFHKSANLYDAGRRLQGADEVVVCAGSGLSDVLCLAFMVEWAQSLSLDSAKMSVARMAERPGDVPPVCLPHLSPAALAERWRPAPLSPADRSLLHAFWRAWVGRDLAAFTGRVEVSPAWLQPSLDAWSRRQPAADRGLAAWDERLLTAALDPETTLGSVIGEVLRGSAGDADPVGDLVLLHRLASLANEDGGESWVRLGAPRGRETPCGVTSAGRAALEGAAGDGGRALDWARALADA
jgi:hypothetical protein